MKKELISDEFTVKRNLPLNYEMPGFNLPAIKQEETYPSVYLYKLNNAFVAPHGIVMKCGRIVPASVSYAWRGRASLRTFYKRILLCRVKFINKTSVVFHNSYYRNYYHWLLEIIPRLFSIKKYLKGTALLVPDDIQSFQYEFLELFDSAGIEKFSPGKVVFTKKLLLPEFTVPDYGGHNPALISAMADWLIKRAGINKTESTGKRIFIVREQDKVRKLVNQEEVIELCRKYGFISVMLDGKSVKEQIKLFAEAECVAGVQGAGLSNMIFMPKKSLIINFLNKTHNDVCFFNLANAMGHRIIIQQCETVGETDLHPQHYNMRVDINELKDYLEKFL